MNSVLLKRVDEDIENLIELIRKVARAEQKHCILHASINIKRVGASTLAGEVVRATSVA